MSLHIVTLFSAHGRWAVVVCYLFVVVVVVAAVCGLFSVNVESWRCSCSFGAGVVGCCFSAADRFHGNI